MLCGRSTDHRAITRSYIEAADALEQGTEARTTWLCRVLGEELLAPVHDRALWSLARSCRTLVARADHALFERFISDVFGTLRIAGVGTSSAALDLVRRIGVAALDSPDPAWEEFFQGSWLK